MCVFSVHDVRWETHMLKVELTVILGMFIENSTKPKRYHVCVCEWVGWWFSLSLCDHLIRSCVSIAVGVFLISLSLSLSLSIFALKPNLVVYVFTFEM